MKESTCWIIGAGIFVMFIVTLSLVGSDYYRHENIMKLQCAETTGKPLECQTLFSNQ